MTPIKTPKISNEKEVYSNLKDTREVWNSKFNLGQLVRTADIQKAFSKADSTNYCYTLYIKRDVLHNTIPSYRLNYLTKRHNENSLLPTKLSLEGINQVMKELILLQ